VAKKIGKNLEFSVDRDRPSHGRRGGARKSRKGVSAGSERDLERMPTPQSDGRRCD
jgi:hypothetical protein